MRKITLDDFDPFWFLGETTRNKVSNKKKVDTL